MKNECSVCETQCSVVSFSKSFGVFSCVLPSSWSSSRAEPKMAATAVRAGTGSSCCSSWDEAGGAGGQCPGSGFSELLLLPEWGLLEGESI